MRTMRTTSSSSEAQLTHEIIKALNSVPGVWCWRQNTGRRGGVSFGKRGAGDISGIVGDGRRLEIEVKKPGNKHFQPEQLTFLDLVRTRGGVAGVVHSVEEALDLVTARILPDPTRL